MFEKNLFSHISRKPTFRVVRTLQKHIGFASSRTFVNVVFPIAEAEGCLNFVQKEFINYMLNTFHIKI